MSVIHSFDIFYNSVHICVMTALVSPSYNVFVEPLLRCATVEFHNQLFIKSISIVIAPVISKLLRQQSSWKASFSKDGRNSRLVDLRFVQPVSGLFWNIVATQPNASKLQSSSDLEGYERFGLHRMIPQMFAWPEEVKISFWKRYFQSKIELQSGMYILELNPFNFDGTPSEFKALGSLLATHQTLNVLKMESVCISVDKAMILLEAFGKETPMLHSELHTIILVENGIGEDLNAVEALVRWMLMIKSLSHISLIRNNLDDDALPAIAKLILYQKNLLRLSLCWNGLRDASVLINALYTLHHNSKFAELDLSHNFLDDRSLQNLHTLIPVFNAKSSFSTNISIHVDLNINVKISL